MLFIVTAHRGVLERRPAIALEPDCRSPARPALDLNPLCSEYRCRESYHCRVIQSRKRRHLLSALVQNQPGVLAHVSGMFASRGFNIESLAVGETETPQLSRITVVVMGDDRHLDQVRKQLEKIVTVVKVHDISSEDYVERDLMLIKIHAPPALRPEIKALVQIFRGRILDVSPDQLMIEISGQEKKIEAFIEQVRPYGIQELARTGRIALVRGDRPLEGEPGAEAATERAVRGARGRPCKAIPSSEPEVGRGIAVALAVGISATLRRWWRRRLSPSRRLEPGSTNSLPQ